jgi:hypothetical protein
VDVPVEALDAWQRSDRLDAELLQVKNIVALKEQICARVEAGEMPLIEAADRFRDLEEVMPHANPRVLQSRFPTTGERERYGLQVIVHVLQDPDLESSEAKIWRCILRAELKELSARGKPSTAQ